MNAYCAPTTTNLDGFVMNLVTKAVTVYNGVSQRAGGTLEPDILWIHQISTGDTDAFERLCRAYQNRLFGFLFRMIGDRERAEEVLNEVFLGVWQGAARFKGDASPATWIFRIARNRALSCLSKTTMTLCDEDQVSELEDEASDVENNLVRRNLVNAGLRKLSREHRDVVEMTFYLGLSYKEISGIVDCPVNTVKTRMFHAKQQLRLFMERSTSRGLS